MKSHYYIVVDVVTQISELKGVAEMTNTTNYKGCTVATKSIKKGPFGSPD